MNTCSKQMLLPHIGNIVKFVRHGYGFSQRGMAIALGCPLDELIMIEDGKRSISAAWWLLFCRQFAISPDVCKYGDTDPLTLALDIIPKRTHEKK